MKLGIAGYGLRASHIANQLSKRYSTADFCAIADPDPTKIEEAKLHFPYVKSFTNLTSMLETEVLDGIIVGTRCHLHTEMAAKIFPYGIPLFLEKPVSISIEQLKTLYAAAENHPHKVVVSFPLRFSKIIQHVKQLLDSELIGSIEHVVAVNHVPYGSVYFQSWYRDEEQTGGLFLQKATHDFDYLNYLIGEKPVQIAAMDSKQIFTGSKPAGLICSECEEQLTCQESAVLKKRKGEEIYGEACSFAEDTGNHDSATVMIRYASGMHASYSQNFFIRKGGAKRGARLMGYKGTVDFDFYTGEVKVFMHHTNRTEIHKIDTTDEPHFGGDTALIDHFTEVIQHRQTSSSSLKDGMISAYMCLKAKESAASQRFEALSFNQIGE